MVHVVGHTKFVQSLSRFSKCHHSGWLVLRYDKIVILHTEKYEVHAWLEGRKDH